MKSPPGLNRACVGAVRGEISALSCALSLHQVRPFSHRAARSSILADCCRHREPDSRANAIATTKGLIYVKLTAVAACHRAPIQEVSQLHLLPGHEGSP